MANRPDKNDEERLYQKFQEQDWISRGKAQASRTQPRADETPAVPTAQGAPSIPDADCDSQIDAAEPILDKYIAAARWSAIAASACAVAAFCAAISAIFTIAIS